MPKIQINDEVEVTCIGLNNYGKGTCKVEGFLVFVDDLYPEEEAKVKIYFVEKNFAMGKVISFIKQSPHRIPSVCFHSADSGTCPLSDIDFAYENELKGELVRADLSHTLLYDVGKIEVLTAEPINGYRNKVTVFFLNQDGNPAFGSFKEGTHDIMPIASCVTIPSEMVEVFNGILHLLEIHKMPIYDFKKRYGIVKGASIRRSSFNGKMSVMLLSSEMVEEYYDLAKDLMTQNPDITGVSVSVNNSDDTNVYNGREKQLMGDAKITERILNVNFEVDNQSFLQVNTSGASLLYKTAIDLSELKKTDSVLDLYCGAGGISLNAAIYAKFVIGIESSNAAIKNAIKNAVNNKISNVEFFAKDASELLKVIGKRHIDTIFMDPPRSGIMKEAMASIIASRIKRIIYVSCDPYTLSRDVKLLVQSGYELKQVKCVNMFPRTRHVETVVLMSRAKE